MGITFQVTFDCADVSTMADFWALALDYVLQPPPDGFDTWEDFAVAMEIPEEQWYTMGAIVDPDGVGPRVFFQKVPEGKTAKNRVHLDVSVGGGHEVPLEERKRRIAAKAEQLVASGATRGDAREEPHGYWVLMQDPEGNEFCLQ